MSSRVQLTQLTQLTKLYHLSVAGRLIPVDHSFEEPASLDSDRKTHIHGGPSRSGAASRQMRNGSGATRFGI
jgi:hypothetical protein